MPEYRVTDKIDREINQGDEIVSFRGEPWTFEYVSRGTEYNGTAKVVVTREDQRREFYAHVFDLTVETIPTLLETEDKPLEREKADFDKLQALRHDLPAYKQALVTHAIGQATSYVWGIQDATKQGSRDTGESMEFGWIYGTHEARFQSGLVPYRRNIRDCYERWNSGQSIEH